RDEGMPNVLLEAMAAALPVVATRVPGSEELVRDGENGFLVDKDDLKGLAQALEKLVSQPGVRRQMGMEGRKIAREYSWERIAVRFVEYLGLRN
ncbi:MAG: glycosyltransferase, partial [Proteobacteria bacterium]|nr:glycosyltransferase [Pseudomonadota bacterium]